MKLLLGVALFISAHAMAAVQLENKVFTSSELVGESLKSSSEQRLVYFWASWCPDCRSKLRGELTQFVNKNQGLELVTVNLDRDFAKGKAFLKEEKLGFTVIRDDEKIMRKSFNIYAVPGWALLKKNGESWELVNAETGSDLAKIQQNVTASRGSH